MQKIETKDLFNINFYKTDPFYGSFKGMNYRVIKYAPEPDSDAQNDSVITDSDTGKAAVPEPCLLVTHWPGPYIYDVTPDAQKTDAQFPFSNEGLAQAADYLNRAWEAGYQSS